MPDFLTNLFTNQVFQTVVVGVSVFVIGQILIRFAIEPYQHYRQKTGEIAEALIYFANIYGEGLRDEEVTEARAHLRLLAASLLSSVLLIPGYTIWQVLPWIPWKKDILEARGCLMRLSNLAGKTSPVLEYSPHNDRKKIEELLKIKFEKDA